MDNDTLKKVLRWMPSGKAVPEKNLTVLGVDAIAVSTWLCNEGYATRAQWWLRLSPLGEQLKASIERPRAPVQADLTARPLKARAGRPLERIQP